jgi:predicted nuclease of predicted toxin-antitoxin system
MQLLADAGISPRTVEFLKQLGYQATHVRSLGLQRVSDPELIDRARADGSVIVTFDLDFGEILAPGAHDEPSVIICRLQDERADSVNQRLSAVLFELVEELEAGALILIDDTRYRVSKRSIRRSTP